jgi:AraC-like DNA-binding protein
MLAREVGLSRSALAQRFTKLVGEPPMRYLAARDCNAAARRLAESRDAVARIAFEAGYESEAAFHRAFKRQLGLAPAAWRRQHASQ